MNLSERFGKELRDLDIAIALVDIAHAAQKLRANPTTSDELFAALERWEQLTGQTNQQQPT